MGGSTRTIPSLPGFRRVRRLRHATSMERARLWLLVILAVLTIGSWALTVYQARTMDMPMGIVARGGLEPGTAAESMAGMTMDEPETGGLGTTATAGMAGMVAEGWSWDGFVTFFFAWAVMMAAMMFPAAAPMLLLFHAVSSQRRARGAAFVPTWVFTAGYLLVWIGVGVVAWVLVEAGSELAGRLSDADRETWGPLVLGAVLLVAGLYQLTPLKRACLDHCRTPLSFVTHHWRDGHFGSLRMGVLHGGYCLGCCWAMFAVLVAAGVMSLAWMLLLTLVVFAEKVLPIGRWGSHAVGGAFLLLGCLVALGATDLPWVA